MVVDEERFVPGSDCLKELLTCPLADGQVLARAA